VRGRAHVRDLFLRLLGAVALTAFVSLLVQVNVLFGARGLLPAAAYLERASGASVFSLPTLFWLDASDGALLAVALLGVAASAALLLGLAPRLALATIYVSYLSFVTVGQSFLAFQWDNLLLESVFFAFFVAPPGLRPRGAPAPHPAAVFLVLWLAFRLHFESGLAKVLSEDPSWRDLTAMQSYYETAPIPTRLAWYAHQLPPDFQSISTFLVLAGELALPALMVVPFRRVRAALLAAFAAMHAVIFLTANYGFFNPLSLVLCVFLLDDGHLAWVAARSGVRLLPRERSRCPRDVSRVFRAGATLLVALTVIPFFRVVGVTVWRPLERALATYRIANAYHAFAAMTLFRDEIVLEATEDGETWESYELRWKPGDVDRAPPFVAPHQPRVDFAFWFVPLGHEDAFLHTLVERLLTEPDAVAPLFARMPFGGRAPAQVRVAVYRYRFTTPEERRETGAWWSRMQRFDMFTAERR
jgi:uncharacterized membrane protein YphA (DoxX/SURF4 family)